MPSDICPLPSDFRPLVFPLAKIAKAANHASGTRLPRASACQSHKFGKVTVRANSRNAFTPGNGRAQKYVHLHNYLCMTDRLLLDAFCIY